MIPPENIILNISNISALEKAADICLGSGQYSPDCLNKWFCPQISSYFTNTALTITIAYIAVSWLLWAYWRWIHDKLDWKDIIAKMPVIGLLWGGDPLAFENKVKFELFVRDKLEKLMLAFIVILWWFYH